MLAELFIKNFAIIDDLRISFSDGLIVLTGETGAGKSIIVGAIQLLLGGRATSDLIRTGCDAAELEALFEIPDNGKVAQVMASYDLDVSEGLLIRRIISRNNRHRIYINERLVTLKRLNSITENLAGISGQHAHQKLLRQDHHLSVLDAFGGLNSLRKDVYQSYHELMPMISELEALKEKQQTQTDQIEFYRFQRDEILGAELKPQEDTQLEQEASVLKNAQSIHKTVFETLGTLYDSKGAVVERLIETGRQMQIACQKDVRLSPLAKRMEDVTLQLEDIAGELRKYMPTIRFDDRRMEEIESRLDRIRKLKRKYGGSVEAILDVLKNLEQKLDGVENLAERISETEKQINQKKAALADLALKLSSGRQEAARQLEQRVEEELATLSMDRTRFKVDFANPQRSESSNWKIKANGKAVSATGIDSVAFMIAPNPGEAPKPLSSIASGGELSRVVLALKTIMAEKDSVETVIFDEVDAGIGGGVAEVVGMKLAAMASLHQVLCITHLPQIAKFGQQHFRITKVVSRGQTQTHIEPLNVTERIEEIARMLGGMTLTKATMDHAAEMLGGR